MTRRRRVLGAALIALPLLTALAAPALATTPQDVADSLRRDPVYVDADATERIDVESVEREIENAGVDVYVAVLPSAAAGANGGQQGVTSSIGSRLGDDAVLITVIDGRLAGGAGCGVGLQSGEAQSIVSSGGGNTDSRILTAIDNLDRRTDRGRLAGGCSGDGGVGTAGYVGLGLFGAAALGGGAYVVSRSRKKAAQRNEEDRADVQSLYDRLASDVSTLDAGDSAVARQALADASERYSSTGAAMAVADTPGEWAAARRTAVEGLTAARLARTTLGLDPGPEIPPPPGSYGPQLAERQRVRVGEDEYEGTPTYEPGHSHYWGGGTVGGQQVPGGWYPSRFWEGMLLGGLLSGGFSGGGYDDHHDRNDHHDHDGFGQDDRRGGGGGDWGGSGGGSGDWGGGGSSGGDWGGSSGGGSGGGGSNNSW